MQSSYTFIPIIYEIVKWVPQCTTSLEEHEHVTILKRNTNYIQMFWQLPPAAVVSREDQDLGTYGVRI